MCVAGGASLLRWMWIATYVERGDQATYVERASGAGGSGAGGGGAGRETGRPLAGGRPFFFGPSDKSGTTVVVLKSGTTVVKS